MGAFSLIVVINLLNRLKMSSRTIVRCLPSKLDKFASRNAASLCRHKTISRLCSTTSGNNLPPSVRELVVEQGETEVTLSGILKDGNKRLRPTEVPENTTTCPISKHNIDIRMEDVLILRQFLDHDHNLYSQDETGVSDENYEKLSEAVRLAQANNLLPRPEGYQMPYRFSERVSMQDVQINFLPHKEIEVLVRGKFGLDPYDD